MTETSLNRPSRRIDLARVFPALFRPRRVFEAIKTEARSTWLTPMLILSLTALLVVLVSGYLKSRAAMMGEIPLPPDWQYWSPEMQDNYMQAQQLTQGKVFMYVIPLVRSWAGLWIGWIVLAGLLHLGSTLLGGRGELQGALNIVAWANLPFFLRDLLQSIYMLASSHAINSPALSGFATGFLAQVLSQTDIFLFWSIALLMIGFQVVDGLPRGKALTGVLVIISILILVKAGAGILISGFGGSAIQRPF